MPENNPTEFSLDSLIQVTEGQNPGNAPVQPELWNLDFGPQQDFNVPLNVNDINKNNNQPKNNSNISEETEEEKLEKQSRQIGRKIKRFIISTIIVVLDLLFIGFLFVFHLYETENSKPKPDTKYQNYFEKYEKVVDFYHQFFPDMNLQIYKNLPLLNESNIGNFQRIINEPSLSFITKKKLLEVNIKRIMDNVSSKIQNIEELNTDISKYLFLPEEIRNILGENSQTDIQRALSSLEIIKFNTASTVFPYLDSIITILQSKTWISKDEIISFLKLMSQRGESDFSSYVYLCYFNPFETDTECNIIWDFDIYYKSILKDKEVNVANFKKIMKYLDGILEQTDIPNFSIVFHNFDPISELINFSVEVNLNKNDELSLIKQGIKTPNVFILTNIINELKKSSFVIGTDIDSKSITIDTRTITDGNTSYTVKTSWKEFSLPVQKNTEKEIFDYINPQFIEQIQNKKEEKKAELLKQLAEELTKMENTETWDKTNIQNTEKENNTEEIKEEISEENESINDENTEEEYNDDDEQEFEDDEPFQDNEEEDIIQDDIERDTLEELGKEWENNTIDENEDED